jgi:hypothetical protein
LGIQKYVAIIAVDGGHGHLLPPHSYSNSMELSPRIAMQKSRVSRMPRGMLPSGTYAMLRNILIAQIGFELACPEPGCDGVLSDFALATMDSYTIVRVVARKSMYRWRTRGAAARVHARISARHAEISS